MHVSTSISQYESPKQLCVSSQGIPCDGYSAHFELAASQRKPDLQYIPAAFEQASPKAMPADDSDRFTHLSLVQTS